jgi:hypothetical protein
MLPQAEVNMARTTKETGKYGLQANDLTTWITGDDGEGTLVITGISAGSVFLEARVARNVPDAADPAKEGQIGLPDQDLVGETLVPQEFTITTDTFTADASGIAYVSTGVQYRFRASADLAGSVDAYLSIGQK